MQHRLYIFTHIFIYCSYRFNKWVIVSTANIKLVNEFSFGHDHVVVAAIFSQFVIYSVCVNLWHGLKY